MTNYNEKLKEVLERLAVAGRGWGVSEDAQIESMISELDEAKQAILRWVANEVIGEDEEIVNYKTMQANNDNQIIRNSQRQKQRNILARHGYKGDQR